MNNYPIPTHLKNILEIDEKESNNQSVKKSIYYLIKRHKVMMDLFAMT